MSDNKKNFYIGIDLKENEIDNASAVKLTRDAIQNDEAVRKLQAETIAALAVQAKIVSSANSVSGDSSFSSLYTQQALQTKQPNMEIDSSSTAYLEIVDGYKIKLKELGIFDTYVDDTYSTLQSFIDACVFSSNGDGTITCNGETLDANTIIILKNATNPSERSYIYLGTENGDSSDFLSLSIDYNQQTIRTFFSAAGIGMQYDASTGICSLVYGNGPSDLGAHVIPMDSTKFNTITASTVEHALLSLESFIETVDANATGGAATLDTRLSSLMGVGGNNLGSFVEGIFSSNSTVKAILQESESAHKAATDDRAAIRSEMSTADSVLQANIDQEAVDRQLADTNLLASVNQETANRMNADTLLTTQLSSESVQRIAADSALSSRLDTVEGNETVEGSVKKAEKDAKDYADAQVLIEKQRAEAAELALNTKIDNLQEGDITFVGVLESDGKVSIRQARIDAGDTRNGQFFKDMEFSAGEEFVVAADFTISFNNASQLVLQQGDKMMALDDISASGATDVKFNVVQANASAITQASFDDLRIEVKPDGNLDIVADSVGRVQLDSAIEADIDDKQSLTQANTITSDGDTHFVTSSALGAQQNVYHKRIQLGTAPLDGTVRTKLTELEVNSGGSGNPIAPSYAHAETVSSHYKGNCEDLSMVMAGGNFEANAKADKAIQATGVYASALEPQNGINIGITAVANGAQSSNVGVVAFSGTAGDGKDRGIVASVSTLDVVNYSATRTVDPFPHNDVAGVFDAKYGPAGCKAVYAYGEVIFEGGPVKIPSASADNEAMRLGDLKSRQTKYKVSSLVDGVAKALPCSLDVDNCIIQVVDNAQGIEVEVTRDSANSQILVKALGGSLTDVKVLVWEVSCDEVVIP